MAVWKSRWFKDLTKNELYEILRSRAEIFVVEQNCAYQDLDGKDRDSLHVFCEDKDRVVACLRAFMREPETAQMGRVLTLHHGTGLGGELLERGIREIRDKLNPKRIYIEAQSYAAGYYEKAGFKVCSEEFLEDGILHVRMMLDLSKA